MESRFIRGDSDLNVLSNLCAFKTHLVCKFFLTSLTPIRSLTPLGNWMSSYSPFGLFFFSLCLSISVVCLIVKYLSLCPNIHLPPPNRSQPPPPASLHPLGRDHTQLLAPLLQAGGLVKASCLQALLPTKNQLQIAINLCLLLLKLSQWSSVWPRHGPIHFGAEATKPLFNPGEPERARTYNSS